MHIALQLYQVNVNSTYDQLTTYLIIHFFFLEIEIWRISSVLLIHVQTINCKKFNTYLYLMQSYFKTTRYEPY